MADNEAENPILAAVMDDVTGRVFDVDFIQGLVGQVRAHAVENAAAYFEAEAQLAEARRLLVEAAETATASLPPPAAEEEGEEMEEEGEEEEEELVLLLVELHDYPEVSARAAAHLEIAVRVEQLLKHHRQLSQALAFLVALRAIAFAVGRAPLLPRVLLAVAVAYALAYVASWGRVVPGLASLVRIAFLVLCFLLGRGPRLMLGV